MDNYKKSISKYLQYVNYEDFEYSINISLKYKYIYVETPKVACSTIKDTLQRMELDYPELVRNDTNDLHLRDRSPLLSPSQTCGFERLLNNPDYFVYCFVRNPYARLLSAYLEKIVNSKHAKRDILIAMGKDPKDIFRDITFREFVDTVCSQSVYQMNLHWRVQYYQTFQDSIEYKFIGKLERFENDIAHVFSKIRRDYADYYRPEIRHATNSDKLLNKYYSDDLQEKVFNKYKIDFEYFGYSESFI